MPKRGKRGKLTVQHGLAEGHDGGAKGDQDGEGSGPPGQNLGGGRATTGTADRGTTADLTAASEVEPKVGEVEQGLGDVEGALGGGEAAAGAKRLPAVDVVDLAVQRVRHPQRPVQRAPFHCQRP